MLELILDNVKTDINRYILVEVCGFRGGFVLFFLGFRSFLGCSSISLVFFDFCFVYNRLLFVVCI